MIIALQLLQAMYSFAMLGTYCQGILALENLMNQLNQQVTKHQLILQL